MPAAHGARGVLIYCWPGWRCGPSSSGFCPPCPGAVDWGAAALSRLREVSRLHFWSADREKLQSRVLCACDVRCKVLGGISVHVYGSPFKELG